MRILLSKIRAVGLLILVFSAGYVLGNFSSLLAQETQLPPWHIMRFIQSEGLEKDSHYTKPVILINPFVVPPGEEDKFIKEFAEVSEKFKSMPGFIDANLHRSINPEAPYAFVNVAHWESLQAFKSALTSPEFKEMHKNFHYQGKASVYEVVKEYDHNKL